MASPFGILYEYNNLVPALKRLLAYARSLLNMQEVFLYEYNNLVPALKRLLAYSNTLLQMKKNSLAAKFLATIDFFPCW